MKLRTLEIQGFGPFKSKQTIDFTKYANDGLFLIEGETGAGKSSILDAITWALYSFTARWIDSKANAEFKSVRSHFCDPNDVTRVDLTFDLTVGNKLHTYRIERSIPGLAKDGSEKDIVVRLFEVFGDGSEEGLAASVTTVASKITELVRLDKTEFLQVVLLAQGRFQAFLEATSDQRLELLRKLFDTKRFADIQTSLSAKASEIEKLIKDAKGGLEAELNVLSQTFKLDAPLPGDEAAWVDTLHNQVNLALAAAQLEADKAKAESEASTERYRQAQAQVELANLQDEKKRLDAGLKAHKANTERLKLAQKAAKVSALFTALEELNDDLETARAALKDIPQDKKIPRDVKALKTLVEAQSKLVGALEPLIAEEESIADSQEAIDALGEDLVALKQSLSDTNADINALKAERDNLAKKENDLETLKETKVAAQGKLDKFKAFLELQEELGGAQETLQGAQLSLTKAADTQLALNHAYNNNLAASLASDLKTGEACKVCGSTSHPLKAKATGKEVTDKQLSSANLARSKADAAVGAAKTEINRLTNAIEKQKPEFKGLTEKALLAAFDKAEKLFIEASSRQQRIEQIQKSLDADGELQKRVTKFRTEISSKEAEIKSANAALLKVTTKVSKNLGGFKSIADHHESATNLQDAMQATLEALEDVNTKTVARDKASKQFEAKLKAEGFQSAAAFEKAYLDEGALEKLASQVQNYDDELKRLQTLLAEPRFKGLPETAIDVAAATLAADEADTKRTQAETELGRVSGEVTIVAGAKERMAKLMPKIEKYAAAYETHIGLANIVNGKSPNTLQITLESYFAAAELEVILEAANAHLKTMAAGSQYTLQHSGKALKKRGNAGLGIEVLDEFTGRERQPETLSGGEKFQVSLAIALGLAQVVSDRSGAIRVDTLFVDEGFGSLSSEVLDTAMHTLDSLKQGGRTIGLISHVEKMQEEIAAKLRVEKTPRGPSLIRQDM